jgi:sec-independent protein translocase protein TatA
MGNIGPGQLLIIAIIALVIFGGSRLAEVGKGLGEGIKNFKKGLRDDDESPPKQLMEGGAKKDSKSDET